MSHHRAAILCLLRNPYSLLCTNPVHPQAFEDEERKQLPIARPGSGAAGSGAANSVCAPRARIAYGGARVGEKRFGSEEDPLVFVCFTMPLLSPLESKREGL